MRYCEPPRGVRNSPRYRAGGSYGLISSRAGSYFRAAKIAKLRALSVEDADYRPFYASGR